MPSANSPERLGAAASRSDGTPPLSPWLFRLARRSDLRSSPMTATVYAFPTSRIVRRHAASTTARMTEVDLRALRQRWPFGWHEPVTTNDGTTFDRWVVPFDGAIDLPPARTITLQPSGTWTRHDAFGRLIKTGRSVAQII